MLHFTRVLSINSKGDYAMDFSKTDQYQQQIAAARPFEEPLLSELRKFYRVGLTWSSNAIEGNTLTESETKILLEDGLTTGGKPLRDTYEAVGHARAYDYMFTLLHADTVTEENIQCLHRLFYQDIDAAHAGAYRTIPVFISGSNFPVSAPDAIPVAMRELIHWAGTERKHLHPIQQAALLHQKFVFIHPFIDGNGRVGRLLMNILLIQNGWLPVIIPPIRRADYIYLLEKAHTDPEPFIEFIGEMELESQKDMIRLLHL